MKKAAQATPNHQLKLARMQRNWSQLEVADSISTTPLTVSRWERGITIPTTHFRRVLCALFAKSPQELGFLEATVGEHGEGTAKEPVVAASMGTNDTSREPPICVEQSETVVQSFWNVPFRRNPYFTGRISQLEHLREQLSHTQQAPQPLALSGLGGIGKTQIAVEYAYRYRNEYEGIFWIRAVSRETLAADFVALAHLLHLPGQDSQEQMHIIAGVKRWLIQHTGWLLILDNADDLSLLADYLPVEQAGYVLLTTREQATGTFAHTLSVEKMDTSEGLLLLLRRAKFLTADAPLDNISGTLRHQVQAIVKELDGLPLALEQAGAYIEETGCSCFDYLALYRQRRAALLRRRSRVSSDYPHTVASTWELAFQQVEQDNPAAADLLRLCAFLHPDAIPETIFTTASADIGPILQPIAADSLLLNDAIQVLRRYSLLKRDSTEKLLNVHRLVQAVLRDGLVPAAQQLWAERAVYAINAVFPEVSFDTWHDCEQYLPHALVCADLIERYDFTFPEAARLLDQTGCYLRDRGLFAQAEPLLLSSIALREQSADTLQFSVAAPFTHLAILYREAGKYEQAEPLFQRR